MNAAPKTKIGITQIIINRVEGPTESCGLRTFTSYAAANVYLKAMCDDQNPKLPGASKVDFRVHFSDGEEYKGRFDAAHPTSRSHEQPDLGNHIRRSMEYLAGLHHPSHMRQEAYDELRNERLSKNPNIEKESIHFLKTYALIDLPTDPTPETIKRRAEQASKAIGAPVTVDDGRKAQAIEEAANEVLATTTTPHEPIPSTSTVQPVADLSLSIAIQQVARTISLMEQEVQRLKADGKSYASMQNRALAVRKALAFLNNATTKDR